MLINYLPSALKYVISFQGKKRDVIVAKTIKGGFCVLGDIIPVFMLLYHARFLLLVQ